MPLLQADTPETATMLACRLARADGQKTRVHLAYILEVPRQLPLNAPLPEQEKTGGGDAGSGGKVGAARRADGGAHVARTRDAGEEIVHLAGVVHANIIVLATAAEGEPCEDFLTRIAKAVLDHAPCEVILNKLPSTG